MALLVMVGFTPAMCADDDANDEEFVSPVAAERPAAAAVRRLGGWYELDDENHVVEVNMVYHEDSRGRRQDNNQTTDDALPHLPGFPRLKLLLLQDTQATDDGLKFVGQLSQLERLYIWNGRSVTDEGVGHLKSLTKLNYLHLSQASITDEAISHLSEIPSLEGLSMQQNDFSDKALEYAARLPRLKSLIIDNGAQFTDEGMQHVRKMPRLEEFWLQKTGISEEGLKSLHGLNALRRVILSSNGGSGFSRTVIDDLQQATPDLAVQMDGQLLHSVNALRAAADPVQQKIARQQAEEGLKAVENFLKLFNTKRDSEAAEIGERFVISRMRPLRSHPDFDGLEVSVASGNGEAVQVLTSPAVIQPGAAGGQRQQSFLALKATKKESGWRVNSVDFQELGRDNVMQRFIESHPGAQKIR
jgi:hypothetical protein